MRDDLDTRTTPVRSGMSTGTWAAIAAAVLIVGALFLWPRDTNHSASTAPSTTVGQTRTAPAPVVPAPAPAAPSADQVIDVPSKNLPGSTGHFFWEFSYSEDCAPCVPR